MGGQQCQGDTSEPAGRARSQVDIMAAPRTALPVLNRSATRGSLVHSVVGSQKLR